MDKRLTHKLLYFVILLAVTGNILLLHKYQFDGDFPLYLHQAEALAKGSYSKLLIENADMMDRGDLGPDLYPIAYPLLLSPIFLLSENPSNLAFIYLTFCIFLIGVFLFYRIVLIFKLRTEIALLLSLCLLLSPVFLKNHNSIGSDSFGFTIGLASVYLYIRFSCQNRISKSSLGLVLTSFFLGVAIFTRFSNIAILIAIIISLLLSLAFKKKSTAIVVKQVLLLVLFPVIFYLLNIKLPLTRPGDEWNRLLHANFFEMIFSNAIYYFKLLAYPLQQPLMDILRPAISIVEVEALELVTLFLVWTFYIFAGYKVFKLRFVRDENITFIVLSCLGILGIYILWPYTQGERFIYFIYPFLFLVLYKAVYSLKTKYVGLIILGLTFIICIKGVTPFRFLFQDRSSTYEIQSIPGTKDHAAMMSYIKDSIVLRPGKVIGSNSNRVVHFYTKKKSYTLKNDNFRFMQFILWRGTQDTNYNRKIQDSFSVYKTIGTLVLYKRR